MSPGASRRRFLTGAAAAAAAAGLPVRTIAAAPTEINLLFPRLAPGADYSFLWAADALGFFAQEGLKVAIQATAGSPQVARLIGAGQGDIGIAGAEATIAAAAKGIPIKDVFTIQQRMIYSVGAPEASSIRTIGDLKGKRIGVQSLDSSPVFVAQALLRSAHLDPARDVVFVPIGVGARAVTAVKAGQVDAAAFHDTQFFIFRENGIPFRLMSDPAFAPFFTSGYVVKPEMIAARPQVIIGVLRATAKSLAYSFANPAASVRAMDRIVPGTAKNMASSLGELRDRLAYEQLPPGAHGLFGWNTAERWRAFAEFLARVQYIDRPIDGGALYDGRFLKQANAFDVGAIDRAARSA